MVKGRIILSKEKPLDFKAVSSLLSDMLPNVINEERRIAKGKANGIRLAET